MASGISPKNGNHGGDAFFNALTNNNLLVRKLLQSYSIHPQQFISKTHTNENGVTVDSLIVENLSAEMAAKIKTVPSVQGLYQVSLASITNNHYIGQFVSEALAADAIRFSLPFDVSALHISVYAVGDGSSGGDLNIVNVNDATLAGTAGSAVTISAVNGQVSQGVMSFAFASAVPAGTGIYVKLSNSGATPASFFLSLMVEG